MDIAVFDENAAPFSAEVMLEAAETDALVADALARLARILKCREDAVRKRAAQLLTAREMETYLRENVTNRAADKTIAEVCPPFVGAPKIETIGDFDEHETLRFGVVVHPVPAMELDLKTPIAARRRKKAADESTSARSVEEAREDYVAETLRARLSGIIPDALLRDALARKKNEFMAELAEKGITYREYRIANRVKPQEVQDALYDEAFDELSRDIALDTVFIRQKLETTADDEAAVLAKAAPGREASLREELEATGKLWMLAQKTRRVAALRWAMEHLLEK